MYVAELLPHAQHVQRRGDLVVVVVRACAVAQVKRGAHLRRTGACACGLAQLGAMLLDDHVAL